MEIKSDDDLLLNNLIKYVPAISSTEAEKISAQYKVGGNRIKEQKFEFPFDKEIIVSLEGLLPLKSNEALYNKIILLKQLWFNLVDKSIKCLRFFDGREPYLAIEEKKPQAYGIEELKSYYEEFAEFEALLYGSNQFYRDHVIHLFRTWLIGFNILINKPKDKELYNVFQIEGVEKDTFSFNFFECISIWTISSLCHDLGYPLEKFQSIINRTQKMMEYLVSQPKIQQDITFSGTQDKLNEYIVRLISSKMKEAGKCEEGNPLFQARTQSKYYIKYSKSLEDYSHGIISAIIIYKALLYFLESDFSFHDDYKFRHEDAKQFYLRREILRSISSHTCGDIYHMHSNTFPLLLIISDDLQEWGRKRWFDFYLNQSVIKTQFNLLSYEKKHLAIEYIFEKIETSDICSLLKSFYKYFNKVRKIFRDGQDTANRIFNFYVKYLIRLSTENEIHVTLLIPAKEPASFKIEGKNYNRDSDFRKAIGSVNEIGKVVKDNGLILYLK